jgi:hypothetical protein
VQLVEENLSFILYKEHTPEYSEIRSKEAVNGYKEVRDSSLTRFLTTTGKVVEKSFC